MAVGKERYTKNVIYLGGGPSFDEGHGLIYLLGEDGMMYYYDYITPDKGEVRDQFVRDVYMHYMQYDGRLRVSFVFATNIIHSLTQIVYPHFLGMDAEMEPLEGEGDEAEESGGFAGGDEGEGYGADDDSFGMDDGGYGGADDADDEDDGSPWGRGGSFGGAIVTEDDPSLALGGTESVPHESAGNVEDIADTPIPFELWLFSIKKLGQNFAAATEHYERLSEEEQAALHAEYNQTFGFS